ncbi:hypothetical protein F5141DRAFT_1222416 [Pisolithus sp. B1]|nr:hypothetical protein F5141DRAFT_1222416 [Pisolithus sp. B1]
MDLPELAEDGCNWQTYGSWVLKAISEDSLMGHLDGSETRPTTPKLLQEYGARWTPRTNKERDVVTAWKTADNAWHQQATMAHQFIIYGLPNSILMLYIVNEAAQQCHVPSEQYATEESAPSTCNSNNGSGNSPSDEGNSPESPIDCAETIAGCTKPKTEVVDAWQVEDNLLEVEDRATDSQQSEECASALEAPDKGSQCASDKVAESGDLPEMSSKALDPVDSIAGQATGYSIKCIPQTRLEYSQRAQTNSKTILNIPDPPGMCAEPSIPHAECSTLQNKASAQMHSSTSTELELPVYAPRYNEAHIPYSIFQPPEHENEKNNTPLTKADGQHLDAYAKRPSAIPAAPRPPQPLSASAKRIAFIAGGPQHSADVELKTVKLGIRATTANMADMRGNLPDSEPCPKEPDKAENTGGGGDDAVRKEFVDLCRAEKSMLADSGSQQGEQEAKQLKHSPAPPAASPNGMMDVLIPLMDRRQRGRIKAKAESISNAQMQQNTYCTQAALMQPFLALLALSNRSLDPVGGLQTMNICYNEVRHARQTETRRCTYQIVRILMWLVQPLFVPMKRLKYPAGGYKMAKRGYNEIRHAQQVETRGGTYRTACILMQLLLFLSDPSK